MNCCDYDELEALIKNELDTDTGSTVLCHVTDCATCRQRLEEAAANLRMMDSLAVLFEPLDHAEASAPPTPEAIGDYAIVREIGRGGMGTVYEAHQQNPERSVAVKVLHKRVGADGYWVRLFRREARALARLEHPGIAAIHAADQTKDGQHFLVLELVQGMPLDDYVRDQRPNRSQRLLLVRRACAAINYAHQRGVIHLDIKPSNILVDSDGRPKILDFGLARIVDPDAPMTTSIADAGRLQGTLPYMSPEQFQQDPGGVDLRSDVYALGVILYELLTGRLPYQVHPNVPASLHRFSNADPPQRPSSVDRSLRGDLETIMLKALEPDPARRYQSALALAEDLERWETNQPILARPPSGLYQFRKLVSRHKIPFSAAGVLFVLLIVFGVSMSAMYADKNEAMQQTKVTIDYLGFMLASANPGVHGRDVTVREVLDRTSETVAQQLSGRPAVEAYVRSVLGTTYYSLGLYEQAEEHQSETVAIRRRILGTHDRRTLESINDLAVTLRRQGKFTASIDLHRENFEARRQVLGEEHPETAVSAINLGSSLLSLGRYADAERHYSRILPILRRVHGNSDANALMAMNNRAVALHDLARYDEAEQLLRETLELKQRAIGKEHPSTLNTMGQLVAALREMGKTAEAEELCRRTLEIRRRRLGAEHLDTMESMRNWGALLTDRGDLDQAAEVYGQTADTIRNTQGSEHPLLGDVLLDLAEVTLEQGAASEAERMAREALTLQRGALPELHPEITYSSVVLSICLRALGRHDEADAVAREVYENLERAIGDSPEDLVRVLERIVKLYDAHQQPEGAAKYRLMLRACRDGDSTTGNPFADP